MNGTLLLDHSDRVIAKAWADESFKTALMTDPRAALESQGIEIPEGMTLKVLENSETVFNLVLPKRPELGLVGEALDGSAEAGRCGGCGSGGCGSGGCGCGGGGGCLACNCICW